MQDAETYNLFRESIREFAKREVSNIASRMDREDYFPIDVFRKMGKAGFLGTTIPEKYGGSGMGYESQAIIEEELGMQEVQENHHRKELCFPSRGKDNAGLAWFCHSYRTGKLNHSD
jgi:isovaleryl-CoA dehydrogenase (EC 1.3.99.10)